MSRLEASGIVFHQVRLHGRVDGIWHLSNLSIAIDSIMPPSDQMYPSSMFTRPHVSINGSSPPWPPDIASIRSSYERRIKLLAPEPRGERIGFFTQVEYVVKGVGAVVATVGAVGLVYGIRRLARR